MDYISWRAFYTVLVFVLFIGVVIWAYSKHSKKGFDEAANLIFDEDEIINPTDKGTKQESKPNE